MRSISFRRSPVRAIGFYALLLAVLVPFMFVFYYMVTTSLKEPLAITSPESRWVFSPTLDNYRRVFDENEFLLFTKNSLTIATLSTGVALLIGVPAAFAIAHYRLPRVGFAILSSRLAPGISFLIPWFIIFRAVGWIDTIQAVVLAHLLVNLPLIIWLLISYFEDLSPDLLDAARIDGATLQRAFVMIALPLTRGGIAAAGILGFIFSWNNFMFSLVLANRATRTLPVAVFNFMSYGALDWGAIAAAATVMVLPVIALTFISQRQIMAGLSIGADR